MAFPGDAKKLYYSIGEVSRMTNLPSYVLRFWETEFPELRPQKNRAGKRVYQQIDIERIQKIKKLLYEDRFTIAGARQALREEMGESPRSIKIPIENIRRELKSILELLKSYGA
ncbi:MAG: MerR family transcriptional regulator [bacterium]